MANKIGISREELLSKSKEEIVDIFFAVVEQLIERIEYLEDQLSQPKKNSKNSSKPPSMDYKSNKPASNKKRGPKKGHKPNHKKLSDTPDIIKRYRVSHCPDCGHNLSHSISNQYETRQWIEIPEIKINVIEQRRQFTTCPVCRKSVYATVPETETIDAWQHIGPNLKSLICVLKYKYYVSMNNIVDFIKTFSSGSLCVGSIDNVLKELSVLGTPVYERIHQSIQLSENVGVDETGWRVKGKNYWSWVFQNDDYTYFKIAPSRGSAVPLGVLGEDFKGTLLSDFYSSYNPVKAGRKAKCMAHLIRDLKYGSEIERKNGENKGFCISMLYLIDRMMNYLKIFINSPPKDSYEEIKSHWNREIDNQLAREDLKGVSRKLQKRIKKHRQEIFLFTDDRTVSATNNTSEQAERKMVLHRKMSNGSQSEYGAECISKSMSILETARKQKVNIASVFKDIFEKNNPEEILFQSA